MDSRGNPTVEADVFVEGGVIGRAAVPSGASTGTREAVELRDGDKAPLPRQGRAARPSANVNGEIRERAARPRRRATRRASTAAMIELDGTDTKARLGANALLAVSLAAAHAAARASGHEPVPPARRRRARRSCRCR